MSDPIKCEKCKEAEANVYFASISGKGKASRHRYCKKCAAEERVRLMPLASPQQQQPTSVLGMVQQALQKSVSGEKTANETPDQAVKRLTKAMQAAIAKEDYETAAKVRDEITAIQKRPKQ
jgi:protein-arginine kinase activator protein McsA